jgi:hypothetical protein
MNQAARAAPYSARFGVPQNQFRGVGSIVPALEVWTGSVEIHVQVGMTPPSSTDGTE